MNERWIAWFDEVGLTDLPVVGGKNASLGVRVPDGFAVTAGAFRTVYGAERGIYQRACSVPPAPRHDRAAIGMRVDWVWAGHRA
jgi:hypothetical protein